MTKEIEDIKGRPVKAGHIIRIYSDLYIVGIIEGDLWAEKFGSKETRMMVNWDGHFEIIGQTIDSLLTPPISVQERAKEWKDVTDADLIEAAKLFRDDYEWSIKDRTDSFVILECTDYSIWFWLTDDDFVDFEEKYTGDENIKAHGGESEPCSAYRSIIDMVDYFRSKGYNLPNKFAGAAGGSGMQWVKASERTPLVWSSDEQHYKLDGRMVSGRFFKEKSGDLTFEYYDSLERDYTTLSNEDFGRVQWLDESPALGE